MCNKGHNKCKGEIKENKGKSMIIKDGLPLAIWGHEC
jgi:hypothetical protein